VQLGQVYGLLRGFIRFMLRLDKRPCMAIIMCCANNYRLNDNSTKNDSAHLVQIKMFTPKNSAIAPETYNVF